MEVENPIWNIFCYCNFFQISMDFKLPQRFRFNFEMLEMCSLRLIASTIANPSELKFRQKVLPVYLQI
jgi:hypothetical protein